MTRGKTAALLCGAVLTLFFWMALSAGAVEPLEQLILDACIYNTEVDLSEYALMPEELQQVFNELYNDGSLPWYTTRTYTFSYDQQTNHILTFIPANLDETAYDRDRYEQRLNEILAETVFDGMSQWQIALSVHDYLVSHAAYDESLTLRTGYDLLIGGSAVCVGYTEVYQQLLVRAGVPCRIVSSPDMEHQWNLVNIDGAWYHVDVTWDDPVPDLQGHVSHHYFLLTDEEIRTGEGPHYGWDSEIICTDTRFSEGFWKEIRSRICYTSADTCCLIREENWKSTLCSRNGAGEETAVYADDGVSLDLGDGAYIYPHMGLSLWNGRLWFSDSQTVYSLNPDGSNLTAEYIYNAAANARHILGCHVAEDTIFLILRTHDDEWSELEIPLEPAAVHVHSYTETVIAPTCVTDGRTIYICACGITGESNIVKATGHHYRAAAVRTATIFSEGYTRYICRVCGEEYTQQEPRVSVSRWISENTGLVFTAGACMLLWGLISGKKKHRRRKTSTGGHNGKY